MDFGSWLAEKRGRAAITQRELAKGCGVTPAYIAHLENGTSEPPPRETCRSLARTLGIRGEEVWQRSSSARLKKWLRREGYTKIS